MIRILIGIPTYDRRIDIELVRTLIFTERRNKYHLDYVFPVSSHLSRSRNLVCHQTLKGSYDWLLFLDSDIGIHDPEFIDKLLETAYRFDAKIVGGAYRMKKPNLDEIVYIAEEKLESGRYENIKRITAPLLSKSVGTGIMLIARKVLETIPDPWFTIVDKPNLDVMPEDFEFCRKADEAGFNIALDSRFETHHYGQFSWSHIP